ncbi:hypothetical protein [Bdellovibrio sp. HCB209]|uniref:hypothetical protein n=1 Tax=Bdellovibrio sp. HCB209 TaxID=3394354 RepID=UPI0039B38085
MKLHLKNEYFESLNGLMSGHQDNILAHIRAIRSQEMVSFEELMEQKILSFRVALKSSETLPDVEELKAELVVSPDLRAEVYFVRGMLFMHSQKHAEAQDAFKNAFDCYAFCENHEKGLSAEFNMLIAQSFLQEEPLHMEFLNTLEKAQGLKNVRIQASCARQLSYISFDQKNYVKAETFALMAVNLFTQLQGISDLHLALANWADCLFEMGKIKSAFAALEKITGTVDQRVQFPLAYINAKLNSEKIEIRQFDSINPYWMQRYRQSSSFQWKQTAVESWVFKKATGLLYNENGKLMGRVKAQSLEGQLLKILSGGAANRHKLCETLWPEYANDGSLDDRFYRLISRLNSKVGNLVISDGKNYHLKMALKLK